MTTIPRPPEELKDVFRGLVPDAPGVTTRPMFGNLAAFVNGNLFAGLFGEGLFVRVGEADQARIKQAGGAEFAPMPSRPMRGYVMLPPGWRSDEGGTRRWVEAALDQVSSMPPKLPGKKKR